MYSVKKISNSITININEIMVYPYLTISNNITYITSVYVTICLNYEAI